MQGNCWICCGLNDRAVCRRDDRRFESAADNAGGFRTFLLSTAQNGRRYLPASRVGNLDRHGVLTGAYQAGDNEVVAAFECQSRLKRHSHMFHYDYLLLHHDRDFDAFARLRGLRTVQPPG